MQDSFSWADFYADAFQKLGHEAYEIVHNIEPLQQLYAKEHGFSETGLKLLTKQIQQIKPDILFLDTINVPPEWVNEIRRSETCIKKIGIFNCSPASASMVELFRTCDFVITCNETIQDQYKKLGLNSFHIYHGFGEKLLKQLKKHDKKELILFSGSLFAGADFHDERLQVLEGFLKNNLPLSIYAYVDQSPAWKVEMRKAAYQMAKILKHIPGNPLAFSRKIRNMQSTKLASALKLSSALRSKLHSPLFGLDMYQTMADSLVTFNIHGGIAGPYAANMRIFEATGVGSCLLTDSKKDLGNLFEIDKEIVTYSSREECIEKATWLLNNPAKANEIGLAGQRRTLNSHTYAHRAEQFIKIFES